ncbi:MAG: hypothetical protein QOG03_885 [Actinomycetota bacterium]|jgi:hypothetical protein|nr:hypothetical protein [Actinomycetota bacterium]
MPMNDTLLSAYVWQRSLRAVAWHRYVMGRVIRDEAGEGVISAAIAVLIMAFLGVLMWVGFKATLGNTQGNVDNQVNQIGK